MIKNFKQRITTKIDYYYLTYANLNLSKILFQQKFTQFFLSKIIKIKNFQFDITLFKCTFQIKTLLKFFNKTVAGQLHN